MERGQCIDCSFWQCRTVVTYVVQRGETAEELVGVYLGPVRPEPAVVYVVLHDVDDYLVVRGHQKVHRNDLVVAPLYMQALQVASGDIKVIDDRLRRKSGFARNMKHVKHDAVIPFLDGVVKPEELFSSELGYGLFWASLGARTSLGYPEPSVKFGQPLGGKECGDCSYV